MALDSPSQKAFFGVDAHVRTALVAIVSHLCEDPASWWTERRPSNDSNARFEDAQTRSLFQFLIKSMERPSANHKSQLLLFGKHVVKMRLCQLANYLRDCCNKHRYNSLNQAEQLADFLLFDEFLRSFGELVQPPLSDVVSCRNTIAVHIAGLLQDVAEIRQVAAPPHEQVPAVPGEGSQDVTRTVMTHLEVLAGLQDDTQASVAQLRDAVAGLLPRLEMLARGFSADWPALHATDLAAGFEPDDVPLATESGWDEKDTESEAEPPSSSVSLSSEEVRGELVALRRQIWEELGEGPSADGILRKRLLDTFVKRRITNINEFRRYIPDAEFLLVDERQAKYLPDIFAIVSRMRELRS